MLYFRPEGPTETGRGDSRDPGAQTTPDGGGKRKRERRSEGEGERDRREGGRGGAREKQRDRC